MPYCTAGKEVELDRAQGFNTCKHKHTHSVWLADTEGVSKIGESERKTGSQAVCAQTTPLGLQLSLHGYGGWRAERGSATFPRSLGTVLFLSASTDSICQYKTATAAVGAKVESWRK